MTRPKVPSRREILSRYGLEHEIGPAKTSKKRRRGVDPMTKMVLIPRRRYARSLERSLDLPPAEIGHDLVRLEAYIVDLEHQFRVLYGRQPRSV